jgi:SAM-dependent methyltransferase
MTASPRSTGGQTDVFRGGEGDAWFKRNRDALDVRKTDFISKRISELESVGAPGQRILEIGCSNGWRLSALRAHASPDAILCGVDPSSIAIEEGKRGFEGIDLRVATADAIPFAEPFNLVIVVGVLCWIERNLLAKSIAEIDRLVDASGLLCVADFAPDYPVKRSYHHRPELQVFTYKQDYPKIFESLGHYKAISRDVFSHDCSVLPGDDVSRIPSSQRFALTILKKTFDQHELEVGA